MKRKVRSEFSEPSLVPLADMLTNTVGIVIFILIFTVLTAGAAKVRMNLPRERETDASPAHFICYQGRLIRFKPADLVKRWLDASPGRDLASLSRTPVDDGLVVLTPKVSSDGVSLQCEPRADAGETSSDLERETSSFRQFLATETPSETFPYFAVYPDGVGIYKAARAIAREAGFDSGWETFGEGEKLYLGSGGSRAKVQ